MRICLNLQKGLVERIDKQRGDIPRSRIVERALMEKYSETPEKAVGSGE